MRNGSSGPRRAVNCAAAFTERRPSRRRRLVRRLVRRRGSCQLTETRGNPGTRTRLNIYMEIQFTQTDLSPHCAPTGRVMNEPPARPLAQNSLSRDRRRTCALRVLISKVCVVTRHSAGVYGRQRQERRWSPVGYQTAGVTEVAGALLQPHHVQA